MVINTIFAHENQVFTGAFNGKIRRWTIDEQGINEDGELVISCCINAIVGNQDGSVLFVGGSDGAVREVIFE